MIFLKYLSEATSVKDKNGGNAIEIILLPTVCTRQPVSDEAVKTNQEEVPGYLEVEGYGLFKYDEGLSYE